MVLKKKKKSSRSVRRHEDKQTSEFRSIKELRKKIFAFVVKHNAKTGEVPRTREIRSELKITNYMFYKAVPGGIREICETRGYPPPRDRFRAVEKAAAARNEKKAVAGVLPDLSLKDVEDPGTRKILEEAQEMKKRAEKAEAKLKIRQAKDRATEAALEKEARLEPRKIPSYISLKDPGWVEELQAFCRDEGTTLADVCEELFEGNLPKEGEDFHGYVKDSLRKWKVRKQHRGPYDLRCRCGLPYEYERTEKRDEKGKRLYRYTRFICPQHQEERISVCPLCKELKDKEVYRVYDPTNQSLKCPVCGESWMVKQPIPPVGTYLKGEKPLSVQQERDAAAFVEWAKNQPGGLQETFSRLSKFRWSLRKIEKELAEGEEKLRRLGAVMAAATKEVAELRGLKDQLGEDVDKLSREKEELQGEMPRLTADYWFRVDRWIQAKVRAEYEKRRRPLDEDLEKRREQLKRLDEEIGEKTAVVEAKMKVLAKVDEIIKKPTLLFMAAGFLSILGKEALNGEELRRMIEGLLRLEKNPDEVVGGLAVYLPKNIDYANVAERMRRVLSKEFGLDDRIRELSLQLAGPWMRRVDAERVAEVDRENARLREECALARDECRRVREAVEGVLEGSKGATALFELLQNPDAVSDKSFRNVKNSLIDLDIRRNHEEYRCFYFTDPSVGRSAIRGIREEVNGYFQRLEGSGQEG